MSFERGILGKMWESAGHKGRNINITLILFALLLLLPGCGREEGAQAGQQAGQQAGRQAGRQEGQQESQQEGAQAGQQEGAQEGQQAAYLVGINAGETIGSGVIYSVDEDSLNVLTAAHVVEACVEESLRGRPADSLTEDADESFGNAEGKVTVRFCDGWETSGWDIEVSEIADIAVIRIPVAHIPEEQLELYVCVETDKKSFDELRAGDACVAEGFDEKAGAVRYEGSILEPWIYMTDYEQYMIWAEPEIQPGMSGGGLFDGNGNFIGILSGGSEDGELAAVPFSLILQFDLQ